MLSSTNASQALLGNEAGTMEKGGTPVALALEGIRVLDFTAHTSGPTATAMLADNGAEVIKVEPCGKGEDTRALFPKIDGVAMTYMWNNRSKKSITINMKDPEGARILKALGKTCDIVVENFRPGMMDRLGLGYQDFKRVKPDIIYAALSAFGQTGPRAADPGFDIIVQGASGIMDLTGEPDGLPTKSGFVLGDMVGGKELYGAILTALVYKLRTGKGQFVDVGMLEVMTSMNIYIDQVFIGRHATRVGRHHNSLAPYGVFRGKHGQTLILAAFTQKHWRILCEDILKRAELVEDPRFVDVKARVEHVKELEAIIEAWLGQFEDIQQAKALLDAAGLVCDKIQSTTEVAQDAQLLSRGGIIDMPGTKTMQRDGFLTWKTRGPVAKFSETPSEVRQAPELGEHNYEILGQIGLDRRQIHDLEVRWGQEIAPL